MSEYDIVRAWKDEDYLNSLSEEQRSQLPENPVGMIEMSDKDMEVLAGGYGSANFTKYGSINFTKNATAAAGCGAKNTNYCNVVSNYCKIDKGYSFFC